MFSLAQEQEEGLEADLFVWFQRYDVYRVVLHSKNVRNGGGRARLQVYLHTRKIEQMALLIEQNHLLLLFLRDVFLVGCFTFSHLVPNSYS